MARNTTKEQREAELRKRMLSGRPFTYGGVLADSHDGCRIVYNLIKRLQKSGLITIKKVGRRVVYQATEAGQIVYGELAE